MCGVYVFEVLHVTTMLYFVMEYTTSILENFAVLDGKPKETLVVAIGNMFERFFDRLKGGRK